MDGSGSWRSASCPLPILTSFCPSRTSTVIPFEMVTESLAPGSPWIIVPSTSFPLFLAKGVPDRNGSLLPTEKTAQPEGARGEEEDPDGEEQRDVRHLASG